MYFELLLVHQFGSLFEIAFDREVCGLHQPGQRPKVSVIPIPFDFWFAYPALNSLTIL